MADAGGAPQPNLAVTAPPRPTISLPPRSNLESLFRGGADVSPGPMTLVASFFNEDADSECRSFSQLLAGAMASPAQLPQQRTRGVVCESRPASLVVSAGAAPFVLPTGLSPGGLLDSPAMFSSNLGSFGMSHQQALAQVTAQAVQSHSHMHIQSEFSSSHSTATTADLTQPTHVAINMSPFQHMLPPTSDANNTSFESENVFHCGQRSQPPAIVVDKPVDDGYKWRKYGQKQVKGSEYPRSYYKCTHSHCPVKKKVECSLAGQVTEIIYKGQHNHQKPPANRRGKDVSFMPNGSNELNGYRDYPDNSETVTQGGNFNRSGENLASMSKRERESGLGTSEQLSGSSDGEEVGVAEAEQDEIDSSGPDPKRRIVDARATESTSSHRTVTEPRIIVQTTSEVDLLDDGYRWRKYGQKVVKGNPHPRSYYKCTYAGCNVRKHVERASTDRKAVITTYEGKHNHDVPAARNSSHNTAAASNSSLQGIHNPIPNNQALIKREDSRNDIHKPIAVLQLKAEHDIP